MSRQIACVLTCKLDGTKQTIILDNVRESNVTERSSLTTHPIATGDIVADHMYKEPATIGLNGTFGRYGNLGFSKNGKPLPLKDIENFFRRIKNEGVLCTLVKTSLSDSDKSLQFNKYQNCVLTNIVWTEGIDSLKFDFSFTEILFAKAEVHEVDVEDDNLPNITDLQASNFTDILLNWDYVDGIVLQLGLAEGFISEEFMNHINEKLTTNTVVAISAMGGGAIAIAASVGAASGPPGWIIVGVGAIALGVGWLVKAIIDYFKEQEKQKQFSIKVFEYYGEDRKKQEQEDARFENFLGEIHTLILNLNNSIKCYGILTNEPQEAVLNIYNHYYTFNFEKNNLTGSYGVKVTRLDDNDIWTLEDITSCPQNYAQCTVDNKLFKVPESGYYVHLIAVEGDPEDVVYEELPSGLRRMRYLKGSKDLTKYILCISEKDPQSFTEQLKRIILEAVTR